MTASKGRMEKWEGERVHESTTECIYHCGVRPVGCSCCFSSICTLHSARSNVWLSTPSGTGLGRGQCVRTAALTEQLRKCGVATNAFGCAGSEEWHEASPSRFPFSVATKSALSSSGTASSERSVKCRANTKGRLDPVSHVDSHDPLTLVYPYTQKGLMLSGACTLLVSERSSESTRKQTNERKRTNDQMNEASQVGS